MTRAGASERALKAAEEVRSLAMDYFGYATATGDTNEVYQKFPVTGVAAIIDAESPDTLSQLSALYSDHAAWSQVTFGTDTERGPLGPLKHLEKEAREAQQEPFNAYEHADCLLLVLDASRRSGLTLQALIHAAEQKLAVNKQREWPKGREPDDMIQHTGPPSNTIRTCNKCGYIGPLVLHPPCPYMSCIVPEAVGTLDEALSQEVVLQKRIEKLKGGLKAAWNVANLAANGNIKMKSIIAEQKERIAELERQLRIIRDNRLAMISIVNRLDHQLSPSSCGVKGHCKVDWTERRAGERRGNAVPGIEDRRKYGSGGSWLERRITSLRGHCGRCEEVEQATDTALIGAEKGVSVIIDNTIEKAVTEALEAAGQYIPGDLRALGWSVATHNDYRQDGKFHTFWLLTKSGQCVKGEGESDAEALNQIRVAIRRKEEKWRQ